MKKLIVFLLSLLGFSVVSCIQSKYGTPTATFELKGKVTDTLDNPIENICIHVAQRDNYYMEKTFTDAQGNYFIVNGIFPAENKLITMKVEDVDGEENGGEFITQIISFPVKKSDYVTDGKKKDEWYEGKASKEINFKLIKK